MPQNLNLQLHICYAKCSYRTFHFKSKPKKKKKFFFNNNKTTIISNCPSSNCQIFFNNITFNCAPTNCWQAFCIWFALSHSLLNGHFNGIRPKICHTHSWCTTQKPNQLDSHSICSITNKKYGKWHASREIFNWTIGAGGGNGKHWRMAGRVTGKCENYCHQYEIK